MKLDKIYYRPLGMEFHYRLGLVDIKSDNFQRNKKMNFIADGLDKEDVYMVKNRTIVESKNNLFVHIVLKPFQVADKTVEHKDVHICYDSTLGKKIYVSKVLLTGNWF